MKDVNISDQKDNDYDDERLHKTIRFVVFSLEDERYGLSVNRIREVLRVGQIRQVPGSSAEVLGVINVRGIIITVVSARRLFRLPDKPLSDQARIIVVELDDEHAIGLLVDQVQEVQDIPEHLFESLSNYNNSRGAKGISSIAHYRDQVIIQVDLESLFE
ncbi:chemotaxis protein [Thiomicrospira aerophila AL3]|uniref:Chemotaxis protein n=1 Tax=Thiomicrospira aerophila AL3 TaxID=717772 RepID=W0DX51_9GAMM|nr:chemotaxis protein CheW [Thiomicrospira aerophila]AHF01559.1 chemotaxis protein [Thiomicrospira aerophila AL3]